MHVYIIPAPRNQFAINPRFPRKRKVMHLHFLGYGTMNDLDIYEKDSSINYKPIIQKHLILIARMKRS